MFDIVRKEMQWGGETLTLETGRIARQADGCVLATLGETTVMAAVTFEKQPKVGFKPMPPVKFRAASSSARRARQKKRP